MPIKFLELHHVGIRIEEGSQAVEKVRNFYSDILGLTTDPGRPDFPDLQGDWLNAGNMRKCI